MHAAAATERLVREEADHSEQQRKLNPANPAECNDGLERVAVLNRITITSTT